jgi:hypothetical protein
VGWPAKSRPSAKPSAGDGWSGEKGAGPGGSIPVEVIATKRDEFEHRGVAKSDEITESEFQWREHE